MFFEMTFYRKKVGNFWRSLELYRVERFDIAKMKLLVAFNVKLMFTRKETFELFYVFSQIKLRYQQLDFRFFVGVYSQSEALIISPYNGVFSLPIKVYVPTLNV